MNIRILLVTIILPVTIATSVQAAQNPSWRLMLNRVGLTPDTAQLDPSKWAGGGPYRLKTFQRLWDDWRLIDDTTASTGREIIAASDKFSELTATASKLLDLKETGAITSRVPVGRDSLVAAIKAVHFACKKPLSASQLSDLRNRVSAVPDTVAVSASTVLRVVPAALRKRNQAFAAYGDAAKVSATFRKMPNFAVDYDADADTLSLVDKLNLQDLMEGGLLLASAVDQAALVLTKDKDSRFDFKWETPLGSIRLSGGGDTTYDGSSYLLIIDTGGNDTYHSGATATDANPISITIDTRGNDTYESTGDVAFGTGVMGYGILLDIQGNDSYKVRNIGLGAGVCGIGTLMDRAGNDHYDIRQYGQGAAVLGIGVLSDLSGDDKYNCFIRAQAFGETKGCGILVDRYGNDVYDANDTQIDFPSPQTAEHNTSLAQGCGFGRRDTSNSLAGGIGILVDGAGDDRYKGGVFSQGISYWYAVGMLVDMAGNDSYEGVWYTHGAAAHYSLASLLDLAGNDSYLTKMTMGTGAGHDFSTAYFHDFRGNDVYSGPCIGFGIWNGIGIFWDGAGSDDYTKADSGSMGAISEARPESLCLGLFLDEGGLNKFAGGNLPKQDTMWVRPANAALPKGYAVGWSK